MKQKYPPNPPLRNITSPIDKVPVAPILTAILTIASPGPTQLSNTKFCIALEVGVGVLVGVLLGVAVTEGVGDGLLDGVAVILGVLLGVLLGDILTVGVCVGVLEGVGVGEGQTPLSVNTT